MIIRMIFLLLAVMPFAMPLEAVLLNNFFNRKKVEMAPPTTRVLVAHDKPGVILEVKGRYSLYDPKTQDFVSVRFAGKRNYMQPTVDGLKWGEGFPGLHQLLVVPDSPDTTILVDGVEYMGIVYVYDVAGTISVINEVDVEEYLRSILAVQLREPLPKEALAALVITARTNAYYYTTNSKTPYWNLEAEQVGYRGCAVVNPKSPVDEAILATRYMTMSREKEETSPFPAGWSVSDQVEAARIPVSEAADLARKGDHAAQILEKAFPGANIKLMFSHHNRS